MCQEHGMQKYHPWHQNFFSLYFGILGQNKHFWKFFKKNFLSESGMCSFRSPTRSHSSLPAVKRCDNVLIHHVVIIIYFLAFLPGVCHTPSCRSQWTYGHYFWHDDGSCEVCASIYIAYISVSKSRPLAVTGPHGQLAIMHISQFSNFHSIV